MAAVDPHTAREDAPATDGHGAAVEVAVINYNTRDQLRRCLRSMPDQVRGQPLRVTVIDNASPDRSAAMVDQEFGGRVALIANRSNLGFAHAVNQALEHSSAPLLLVLNADTEVTGGAIDELCAFMERTPEAGVAGGRLEDADGALQYSCRRFYSSSAVLLRRTPLGKLMPRHPELRRHLMLDWDHAEERRVDWLQGACLMLRRSAVEQVGAMDGRFFLYFEDVDLCRRMAMAGWGVHYVPSARFVHHYRRGSHGGGLLSVEKLHHLQSALRFLAKWNRGGARLLKVVHWLAPLLLLLLDLAVINGGFHLCLMLRNLVGGPLPSPAVDPATYQPLVLGANACLVLAFASLGLYRVERSKDWLALGAATVKAVTWVAMVGVVVLFFAPGYRSGFIYSRVLLLSYYLLLVSAVFTTRLVRRGLLRFLWRRRLLLRRTILVGEPDAVKQIAATVRTEPQCGYEVAALLRTRPQSEEALLPGFRQLIAAERPGAVFFISQHAGFHGHIPLVLHSFELDLEVRVVSSPRLFPYLQQRNGEICGRPAADVTRTPMYRAKRWFKRASDLTLTICALPLVGPAMLALALVIRAQDGGPGFFRQRRVGKGGRTFPMVKLRTMAVDAAVDEEANVAEGPMTMIPNDPRVTPIGRWLRRHKIDELPQLFNVLLGHMSLVGPRPPIAEEVDQYTEWQRCRLAVRPGLTGLWQIDKQRKWRFNEMVELDLQYILNWSLLLDYGVMLRTIPATFRGS